MISNRKQNILQDLYLGILRGTNYHLHTSLCNGMKPSCLELMVNSRCNTRCIMCNIWKSKSNNDLSLTDILALDRVQKKMLLPDETIKRLRRAKLIEGRKPNLHVSATVAKVTTSKADYILTRAQDDEFYVKLIIDYLDKFGKASREEINKLLWNKLSDALDDEQKTNKIANLLTN